MCVKDGTIGTAPVKWPGRAAPQGPKGDTGPQGIQGVGVPMPVANGQWIKGVGGAAVWSPLFAVDVPGLVSASTNWITPTLLNGHAHYGAPFGPCRYRRLASGLVVCDGLITLGASPTAPVFNLPAGFRPGPGRQPIFVTPASATSQETWRITENGDVNPTVSGAAAGIWVSLTGVQFYGDQ
jgi:hypothetical protein